MLDRLAKIQLSIFALITVLSVGAIAIFYLQIPKQIGIGSYQATAEFVAAGGLYKNANVTYRGVTAGEVKDVTLSDDGVVAHMRLNSSMKIPANVTATVKSVSAVGEQYVELMPPEDEPVSSTLLGNGANIGQDRTAIPTDIAGLLDDANELVNTIGDTRVQDLLRSAFDAFNGTGPELSRLVRSARLFVDEANNNWPETEQLLNEIGPFLDAQIRSGDNIESFADGLARFTTQLRNADPQLRDVLATTPDAAAQASSTFEGIRPSFPVLAANLANLGRVGVIYHKSIEQVLVIFPALISALITLAGGVPADEGGKLDFKISLGDPPPCSVGFLPPEFVRSPADLTLRDLPKEMYCKTAQNDPSAVRGARNYPCQEFPGKRAPTVALCRDPKGYVPVGNNPWRGPPIPTGTEPVDPRNILPPNHFPYIPPENDPDPGYPVAPGGVPHGVQAGPPPAPHQPYPAQPPPNTGPAPPPLTAWIPPAPYPDAWPPPNFPIPPPYLTPGPFNPVVEPPGPAAVPPPPPDPNQLPPQQVIPPNVNGVSYGMYDERNGTFVDPAGGVGVYAPGAANVRPAENWVDLMLDPRQA